MKKYFSIFVLSALSAYSVQAADTEQQLRKRKRVRPPVLKVLPTRNGAAGAELVMLLDIDEKGRVKRRVLQEGKSGNPTLRRQAVADAGRQRFTPPKSCETAKDGQTVCKPVKSYANMFICFTARATTARARPISCRFRVILPHRSMRLRRGLSA